MVDESPNVKKNQKFSFNFYFSLLSKDTERIRQLKSVPKDSFVYRLVVCFAAICSLPSYNHLRSIAHLWFDVVQELRTHWEEGKLIPG